MYMTAIDSTISVMTNVNQQNGANIVVQSKVVQKVAITE